jgi:hypothetical protein
MMRRTKTLDLESLRHQAELAAGNVLAWRVLYKGHGWGPGPAINVIRDQTFYG